MSDTSLTRQNDSRIVRLSSKWLRSKTYTLTYSKLILKNNSDEHIRFITARQDDVHGQVDLVSHIVILTTDTVNNNKFFKFNNKNFMLSPGHRSSIDGISIISLSTSVAICISQEAYSLLLHVDSIGYKT